MTAIQLSSTDERGAWMLAVLAKRTYTVASDGILRLAPEQVPLVHEPMFHPDTPSILLADTDLIALKPRTDFIVLGHTYGGGRRSYEATVAVRGKIAKRILVSGTRVCAAGSNGEVFFSQPEPVDKIDLSYAHAYGGSFPLPSEPFSTLQRRQLESIAVAVERDTAALMLYEYPRNPAGCGFLLEPTPEAVAALVLPNLEDPLDPISPTRLAVINPDRWPTMPLPQSTGWFAHDWFPRIAYLGIPPLAPPPAEPVPETLRGYAPANFFDNANRLADAFAFSQGASPGMQFPHFRGGETILLEYMHPKQAKYTVTLPTGVPKIWVDGRKGTMKETEPVIHTVIVEPDLDRVTLLWRGAAPALRPYLPAELAKMPFRVEWPD